MTRAAEEQAPELSIVMPAYDEERNVAEAVAEALRAAEGLFDSLELVAVDDGSRDGTGAILDRLAEEEPRVRVLHRVNEGHGPALATGLDAARGAWLLLLDSDRQVPLDGFAALVARARSAEGLLGVRAQRDDPWVRRQVSRGMRAWLRLLFGVRVIDAGTPFKLLPRSCWEELRPALPDGFPVPAVALAVHALATRSIVQAPVPHRARPHGRSSLHGLRLARFSLRSLGSLLLLRVRLGARGAWPR